MSKKQAVTIAFTEDMKGFFSPGVSDPQVGWDQGKGEGRPIMFHLTIEIPDVDFFLQDPREQGTANGYIDCEALGGRLDVRDGVFRLFVDADDEKPHENIKQMHYQLQFLDGSGAPKTLAGHKQVKDDGIRNIWHDTSTLYFQILDGHVAIGDQGTTEAAGILHILPKDFAHQMTTFKTTGPSLVARAVAVEKFVKLFAGTLWGVYFHHARIAEPEIWNERTIPVYTLEGVKNADITTHHITTGDKLTLSMLRFQRKPCRDVVMLVHGLSTSTDMFIMPEHRNLVSYLLDNGYTDVFSFDWRGSMRHTYDLFPGSHTIDDCALYDYPAAIDKIRELVGEDARIHVICHCVGSIGFHMSLFSGLVDVTSVISNSVSLNPQVSRWTHLKLRVAPFLMFYVLRFPNFNPRWAKLPGPGIPQGKILAKLVHMTHRECDVPECAMLSFMWGDGHPAVYQHENMLEISHQRVGDLFGSICMSYYLHIGKCVRRGMMVKWKEDPKYDALPNNYLDNADKVDTPILYISGDKNHVFYSSNKTTFDTLNRLKPDNRFEFEWIPGYGHQDTLMGKNVAEDVFPRFLKFLNKYSGVGGEPA
jgi:triacylglycerol lipase/cholesterol oxidase